MKEQELAKKNLILRVTTGSRLYGTNIPESDWDKQGIFIPPKEYIIGLQHCNEVKIDDATGDHKVYSLVKYIHLAMANNPNILTLLYTPKKDILYVNKYGQMLLDNRALFLSKKAYHTFKGYAHSQKQKIITKKAEGKRVALIEKYGYDTKFAMNLIRLLYEAIDIMVGKELVYPSPHRKELKLIREGKWDLAKVLVEAERLEALVDEAYVRSDLQYAADREKIEVLQMGMLETFWKEQKKQ